MVGGAAQPGPDEYPKLIGSSAWRPPTRTVQAAVAIETHRGATAWRRQAVIRPASDKPFQGRLDAMQHSDVTFRELQTKRVVDADGARVGAIIDSRFDEEGAPGSF